jgi:aminoglycoside 3-N-acetyltransferase
MTHLRIDERPQTERSLHADFRALGVDEAMTLMVHASLSKIGWVVGGPQSVVRALLSAIGKAGTLAMPAETPYCADPATWSSPQIDAAWMEEVRAHNPLFDAATSPTTMGAIAEAFRTWPGTCRSDHALVSVCARGPLASDIVKDHARAFCEGIGTPFEKLHDLDAHILLLGVGFDRCTALHFAESLVAKRRTITSRYAVMDEGEKIWLDVPDMASDNGQHFPVIGERFLSAGSARVGAIGKARSILFPMRELVKLGRDYFEQEL